MKAQLRRQVREFLAKRRADKLPPSRLGEEIATARICAALKTDGASR